MSLIEHRLEIFRLHSEPDSGSDYWISFFADSDFTPEAAAENPLCLPPMNVEAMRKKPIEYFLSRQVLLEDDWLISGETSGFSGQPVFTVFTRDEFRAGFVKPFLNRAAEIGFPVRKRWLWVGPTGPHIVGKAIREILHSMNGFDPFTVDFDSRWYRRLPEGSLSRERYFAHIIEQALVILESQTVEVLFSTPPILSALASVLPTEGRNRICGVHYAGIASSAEEYDGLRRAFPNAVHMNGYGNSLFGMFPEYSTDTEGIEYVNLSGDRLSLSVVEPGIRPLNPVAVGVEGQVMLSRFDRSILIVNMLERDIAVRTERGIRNPHPDYKEQPIEVIY